MPYLTVQEGERKFCNYHQGEDGARRGAALGCFDSASAAQQQIAALYAHEQKNLELSSKAQIMPDTQAGGLRKMLLVTSNAYIDREREIVSQRALGGYVEKSWNGDLFVGRNPLLLWHAGDPIGDIVFADMEGPFLIEVAQERQDAIVNLAKSHEPPTHASIKAVWNALERESDLGASHQFLYVKSDRFDGTYDEIVKLESSVLPRVAAANLFTSADVIGA